MVRVLVLAVIVGAAAVLTAATHPPLPQQADAFMGSEACRDCHANYFQAWSTTKHARALTKLSGSDRTSGKCIRCHVTDTPAMLAATKDAPTFPNVQCEACHGAGRAHVDAARAGNAATATTAAITEASCTRCHNEESPHYRTFIYSALKPLVHRVQ
jgi:hypothetical protein